MAVIFDPFQLQQQQQQGAQGNMFMNMLMNMALQKMSQNFKEKELNLQQQQHERLLQVKALSSGDWIPESDYKPVEGEQAPPKMTIGETTLVRRKPEFVKTELPGVIGYWSGGEFKIHDTKKDKSLQHVNTANGVMVFDPSNGQLAPAIDSTSGARLQPYQAPRQSSPYEGLEPIHMYNEKTGETSIQWGKKGQPVVTDPGSGWRIGTAPREPNRMNADEMIAKEVGVDPEKIRTGTITSEEAKKINERKKELGKFNLLESLMKPGGVPQPATPSPGSGFGSPLSTPEQERLKQLEELGIVP